MPIWKATTVEETPEIELVGWRVFEVSSMLWDERTRHFSGYNITECEGRASSAIASFDPQTMIGKTESGRGYKLSDVKPRMSQAADREYVWDIFCLRNKLFGIKDVSHEYKKND